MVWWLRWQRPFLAEIKIMISYRSTYSGSYVPVFLVMPFAYELSAFELSCHLNLARRVKYKLLGI